MGKAYWLCTVIGNTIVNKIPIWILRRIWLILMGAKIGKKSVLFRRVEILKPIKLRLGRQSSVGWFTLLDARGGIEIGDNVTVASYSKLITAKHNVDDPNFTAEYNKIIIKDYAWIATGATILGGVTIGKGAVVSAGAVVTKDVPDMAVVGGVPARIIRYRKEEPVFQDDMKWVWLH